jgi:hypothetical protein
MTSDTMQISHQKERVTTAKMARGLKTAQPQA